MNWDGRISDVPLLRLDASFTVSAQAWPDEPFIDVHRCRAAHFAEPLLVRNPRLTDHVLTWITGQKVTELCADLATVIPVRKRPRGRVQTFQQTTGATDDIKITTDDYASILLHFNGGARGVCTVSQISAGRKTRLWFEVDGSEGSLSWNSEEPNTLWIGRRRELSHELISKGRP